ncbi:hypothetical protein SmJEL517_g04833 [Synchytrium microbalum]|uniref:Ketoreductase domain-containing protein n=1 Tax=Synchytrium microbalum TaxID=1806994 RepID=A0A507C204_9FUNG|nr:uncharacterized protein SmJEL517_g04833 [Synchytrium microbalum]TPX31986.1 hypothetical protein SmJEL517_g04833 [Synchytrium microbalum]
MVHFVPTNSDLSGKTYIITGANAGIGKEAARWIAAHKAAKIIMAVRTPAKAEAAKNEIISKTGVDPNVIEIRKLDLASLASVREFAAGIVSDKRPVDVLINNAGMTNALGPQRKTSDGFDETFQSNHLGHFLLTLLLIPVLAETAKGKPAGSVRIANVSSDLHFRGKVDLGNLNGEKKPINGNVQYCNTKLMNVLFTRELAQRLEKHNLNITTTSPQPGFTISDLGSDRTSSNGFLYGIFTTVRNLVGRTTEQGTATIIEAATAPAAGKTNGAYWTDMKAYPAHKDADNADLRKRFWDVSVKMAGLEADPLP